MAISVVVLLNSSVVNSFDVVSSLVVSSSVVNSVGSPSDSLVSEVSSEFVTVTVGSSVEYGDSSLGSINSN